MQQFYYLIGQDADPISWWQMSSRAVIIFFYALLLYRVVPRKTFGGSTALDIVVAVIMGSSLSRALTGNAPLLPTLAATAVLVLLHILLSVLARHFELVSKMTKGRAVLLVRDGQIAWPAMKRAQLGERDLTESLRLKGVGRIEEVAEAYLERNGAISVIKASK